MESFWEFFQDWGVTLLKALFVFFILRCILILADIPIYIPYVDPFLEYLYRHFTRIFPLFKIPVG